MKPIGTNKERDIKTSLITYIPSYYYNSKVVEEIIKVDAGELELLNENVRDVLNQFFVERASWGLETWERIVGVPAGDEDLTLEQRRSIVKSKLRGLGAVTATMIKSVAESFENGEVDVTEKPENYEIIITFVGKRGIPNNLEGIKSAIYDIIPAHLGAKFILTYLYFDDLENNGLIWNVADTYEWDSLEVASFS